MNLTFFTEYLLVSNFYSVIFIALLIGSLFFIRKLYKKNLDFTKIILVAIGMGITLGVLIQMVAGFPDAPKSITWVNEVTSWYGLLGNGFMDLLRMIVVPLIFVSIIRIIINMEDNIGSTVAKTVFFLLATTAVASIIAVVVANIFNIGETMAIASDFEGSIRSVDSLVMTIRNLIPKNPLEAMVNMNIIAVIVFASFIGIAFRSIKKREDISKHTVETFSHFVEASFEIAVSIVNIIIDFMPYAIVALLANVIASQGIITLKSTIGFIVALYTAMAIMFLVHMFMISLSGINPIKYIKAVSKALILAFFSRSSLGTLPVTIKSLTNVGLDEGIASLTGSLGANMGMNACAGIYPAMAIIFVAKMVGIPMDFGFYFMMIAIIALSSIGIAGIPGTATIALALTLSGMGLGEYFPLLGAIIAIDPILDMGRTMLNVSGTMASAVTVGKLENKLKKVL